MQESPLYTKSYDLICWLVPQAQKFPRAHRFGLAERIQRLVLDFQDTLTEAGKRSGVARQGLLQRADVQLEQLRVWLRLGRDLECLSLAQYEHAARLTSEVGRLLGAWIKQLKTG